ncbi:MAG: ATP-binding protein [Gammaproteobacteria bacterium]
MLIERRVAHARTFDAQPCLGSVLSDLSQPLFLVDYRRQVIAPEIIEENHRSVDEQLASLRFYDLGRGCPTNAGILLFGMDGRRWLPGAYIQILTVDGVSLADTVTSEREIFGDLLTVLRELDAAVDAELRRAPVSASALREESLENYPRVAVRELIMNAVMHRSYESTAPIRVTFLSDRIEIQSPGSLYGEVTPENFPRQTSYRNPIVAESLKGLGYVNRYGRGVVRAQASLARNGSRPAEFAFDAGFVLATIWQKS